MEKRSFFAVAPKGLEEVTAQELKRLGALDIKITMGGVEFAGTKETLYRANLWSRSASRVLMPLREFASVSPEMLYDQVRRMKWELYLTPQKTFAVDCTLVNSDMNHSHYAALKVKDAIADRLRERYEGERSSIDTKDPDIKVNIFINNNRCILSLDSSGEALHRRGYRQATGAAPIKENLAAALLLMAGYDGSQPLFDPMCGSGTFLTEGALIALHFAPGLLRERFGFFGWPDFDHELWQSLKEEAHAQILRKLPRPIEGSDRDAQAVEKALENARAAGVSKFVNVRRSVLDLARPPQSSPQKSGGVTGGGIMVVNPPYGERMGAGPIPRGSAESFTARSNRGPAGGALPAPSSGPHRPQSRPLARPQRSAPVEQPLDENLKALYHSIGDFMKKQLKGWTAFILAGNPQYGKFVGLHPSKKIVVFNGPIEGRFLKYEIYEGTRKRQDP